MNRKVRYTLVTDQPPTQNQTLSLHDALPILHGGEEWVQLWDPEEAAYYWYCERTQFAQWEDRKSTRLNSSHRQISYAVFCLKKKNKSILNYKLLLTI